MLWVDVLEYAASAAVLSTFCMSTMIPIRKISINKSVLVNDITSACFYGRDVKIYGTDIWNGPLAAFTLQETDGLNLGRTKCKRSHYAHLL